MPSKKRVGLILNGDTFPFLTLKAAKKYLLSNGILANLPEPNKVRNWNDVYLILERIGFRPSTFLIRDKQHFKGSRRKFIILHKSAISLKGQKKREEKRKARLAARARTTSPRSDWARAMGGRASLREADRPVSRIDNYNYTVSYQNALDLNQRVGNTPSPATNIDRTADSYDSYAPEANYIDEESI